MGNSMSRVLALCALFSFALLPSAASAEPVKLKLSFFTSDRALLYRAAVQPFVDAVNAEAGGIMKIEVYFSGTLSRDPRKEAQGILDGTADIAFVIPGYTPHSFLDSGVIELPGLFANTREATLVFTRLMAANGLRGYEDFVVIGAFGAEPENIHTRAPAPSLGALKDKKIRVNNAMEAATLEALGMSPVLMPINRTSDAIIDGEIDGAVVPPFPLIEFGIGRVVAHHYLLRLAAAPLMVLMNRKKFESLPNAGQDIIRKYSGEWLAMHFIETFDVENTLALKQLISDPKRTVVFPSQSDLDTAQLAFKTVIAAWLANSPRNRELLTAAEVELQRVRAAH
jgi:TRAP-type C4-dicarboxylate transport system substrate-binding protein